MSRNLSILSIAVLILVGGVLLSLVHSASFVYIKVFGRGVEIQETGAPPISHFWHGDDIPTKYRVVRDDTHLAIGIGRETYIPSLRIQSSDSILSVRTKDCGFVFDRNEFEYAVSWGHWRSSGVGSCVKLDETVEIEIHVEGVEEAIVLYGTIKESGIFYFIDSL